MIWRPSPFRGVYREIGSASVPAGFFEMNANSTNSRPWRRRLRTVIPLTIGTGLFSVLAIPLLSEVREARNAAHSATTS